MQRETNSTIDCIFVQRNIFSYQENQLSGTEIKGFEDHIHACKECFGIVADFQSVISLIDKKKLDVSNPFLKTRIIQRLEALVEGDREKPISGFQRILRPISVPFMLLIAVIIGFSLVKQSSTRFSEEINRQNNIQTMKAGLNIPDFIEENNTFFDNH